jgi:hypothetical protein
VAPLATTRTIARRLTDADTPRVAVVLLALASLLLFSLVWLGLQGPAEGTSAPVLSFEDAPTEPTSLVSAPSRIVLPTPQGDEAPATRVIVNHREDGVSLSAQLANGDALSVDLAEAGSRATAITVTSEGVHVCDGYAGSLILEAEHDSLPSDLVVLEVRYADCGEAEPVTLAPSSVNDTSQTWGDEGRAPWKSRPAPPPPPEPEAPQPPPPPPEPEVVEEEVEVEVVEEPEPTPEPEPEPTQEPEPEPEPEPTQEPEPEPTATTTTTSSTSEPTSDDTDEEPTTTETSTEG